MGNNICAKIVEKTWTFIAYVKTCRRLKIHELLKVPKGRKHKNNLLLGYYPNQRPERPERRLLPGISMFGWSTSIKILYNVDGKIPTLGFFSNDSKCPGLLVTCPILTGKSYNDCWLELPLIIVKSSYSCVAFPSSGQCWKRSRARHKLKCWMHGHRKSCRCSKRMGGHVLFGDSLTIVREGKCCLEIECDNKVREELMLIHWIHWSLQKKQNSFYQLGRIEPKNAHEKSEILC